MRFVINDDVSGMVDNNRNRDFELPLLNPPTEDQVSESRAERLKAWERRIRQVTKLLGSADIQSLLAFMLVLVLLLVLALEGRAERLKAWEQRIRQVSQDFDWLYRVFGRRQTLLLLVLVLVHLLVLLLDSIVEWMKAWN